MKIAAAVRPDQGGPLENIRREQLRNIGADQVFKVIRRVIDNESPESTLDVAAFQSAI
jgi:hypothetical protein